MSKPVEADLSTTQSHQEFREQHIGTMRTINRPPGVGLDNLDRYLGLMLQASWEAIAISFQSTLVNGGPSTILYSCVLSTFGSVAMAATLAEMASIEPLRWCTVPLDRHVSAARNQPALLELYTRLSDPLCLELCLCPEFLPDGRHSSKVYHSVRRDIRAPILAYHVTSVGQYDPPHLVQSVRPDNPCVARGCRCDISRLRSDCIHCRLDGHGPTQHDGLCVQHIIFSVKWVVG